MYNCVDAFLFGVLLKYSTIFADILKKQPKNPLNIHMKKFTALFLAAAGVLNAQTYNYDAANETLTITGKGNSVADRISFEGPITPGSTVPGSSEIFGDTKTIVLKDVWSSPDSIRIKYVEPTSAGNKTTIKLINSRVSASGDFDMGGAGQTLILDSQSELNLYGNRLTNTTRLENEGYIQTINGTVSESSYLWDNKTSEGNSGVLGGRGYYEFGNVESIDTSKDFGLIKTRGQITDLEISGDYYTNGNSANTIGDDAYIVGVNASESPEGQAMTISGKLTVEAKQGTGMGLLVNQLGSDDTSLENNYSGEITVKAKNAFGVKVGGNAAKDATKAGDIYQLSVGTLNVESTANSGEGAATGIYAKSVKRGLTADSITVKGYSEATGIHFTEGGSNLTINNIKVSAGADGTATGILAADSASGGAKLGDLSNIDVANMEVSSGSDATGIRAKSVSGKVGNITVSSTNGTASGISADTADLTVGGTISSSSENGNAYGISVVNDLNLTMRDGAEISASAANGEANAIRSENGNLNLNFEGSATINGDVKAANSVSLSNGGNATVNGDIEGKSLAAGAEIGTVSGKMKFSQAADLTVKNSVGSLEIGTIESADIAKVDGSTVIGTATGNVKIGEAQDVAIENASSFEFGQISGNLDITKEVGSITSTGKISGNATIAKNTDSIKIGGAKNLTLRNVEGGTSQIGNVEEDLTANLAGGSLEVSKVGGVAEISGDSGSARIEKASIVNVVSDKVGKLSDNGQGIATDGDLKVSVDNAEHVNFVKVNGGDINGAGNIQDITIDLSDGVLNIGMSDYASRNITVKKATAQVNIGEVNNIDITLANNADLVAGADSVVYGRAIVNGGCNATFQDVNNLVVGQNNGAGGVSGLDGNLTVNGTVNNAVIDNVSGDVRINTVANSARISNAASATIENANGGVHLENLNSATVNNSTADIAAKNVASGLTVGNVANVNLENTGSLNVLDGKTVSGDIVSTTDLTLTNGGSATITGSVSAGSNKLTFDSVFNVNSSASTVISAATLSGAGLRGTINSHYDNLFGFSATDDSSGSLTAETALKGTHSVASGVISGAIEGDLAAVENAYTKVKYTNIGNNVGYEVISNTYLQDAVASTETERALAKIYDDLEYVDGDAAANATSVARKRGFAAMAGRGALGAMLPQSVVHAARMNMDLTDAVHLDTLNRTSATRDMLACAQDEEEIYRGFGEVSVRNINRFATYGGDANIDGSSDYITGGLANVEYVAGREFFGGFGVGGFTAKSNGKGNCGKAETQSVAVNIYADYLFFNNFDWYLGATYAFGMNKAERMNTVDKSRAEWDSNLVGVFSGVRYAWKPVEEADFFVKPTIGVNVNFLMNPSFAEKSGTERLDVDSESYTSLKSIAGLEATYILPIGLSLSGRVFYTHEFCDNRYDVSTTLDGLGAMRVKGLKMERDAGIFGVGAGYNITKQLRIYADYSAEVSNDVYHNLNAGIQLSF